MTPIPINFVRQQIALQLAMQQTSALARTSQQRNPALSRTALGQLNTLLAVLQQSAFLQAALQTQSNLLTPAQLLLLSQEQPSLSAAALDKVVDKWWPELQEELAAIDPAETAVSPPRSDRDLLEEILDLVRAQGSCCRI